MRYGKYTIYLDIYIVFKYHLWYVSRISWDHIRFLIYDLDFSKFFFNLYNVSFWFGNVDIKSTWFDWQSNHERDICPRN